MRLIIELFDCGFFEGAGHTLDLAIGPGMIGLGRPIGHGVFITDQCKNMCEGILIKPPACRCSRTERAHFRALRSSVQTYSENKELCSRDRFERHVIPESFNPPRELVGEMCSSMVVKVIGVCSGYVFMPCSG